MHDAQEKVRQFHRALGVPAPNRITLFEYPAQLRVDLIQEELDEFAEACANHDLPEMIDALCDLLYVTYGAAVAMGVDLEPFYDEVHRSNMAKAGGLVREDGKRLKPPGWTPPDIRGLLERALEAQDEREEDDAAGVPERLSGRTKRIR
jgi:predicted HAD superfamily Cof-like phosphohydrolase